MEDIDDVVATADWSQWGSPVRVRVDASPVMNFAGAVRDPSPVYRSEIAARDAGFDRVPAPPTFSFVMTHGGTFPDLQPPGGTGSLWPVGGVVDSTDPAAMAGRGGLYLHGEQHFAYHRTVQVGDVLEARMRASAPIVRDSRRGPMEVTYMQTRWTDVATGDPVVDEMIVSLFLPDPPRSGS